MEERDELAAWLRLTLTPGVGDLTSRKLLAAFGLPQHIFAQSEQALRQVASVAQAQALQVEPPGLPALLETTWQWLHAPTAPGMRRLLTLADPQYPPALLAIEDPPLLLYVVGRGTIPPATQCLAMVGSRNPTAQGRDNAHAFARHFAGASLTVVSGMALGIDGAAHEGALAGTADGRCATIAVVGTGLDRVYPQRHRALAHRIAEHGLLLSEYPLGTPALAANFPKRNRLIAGLSQGTLVVEAAPQSGSLITARLAGEQGKEVFAIPGSIHSPQSRGCHALIRQGAKLVESGQDVLEELRPFNAVEASATTADAAENTDERAPEDSLLEAMAFDPVGLDALVARTGLDAARLQARLLELELLGEVARLPGGLFQRLGRA